MKGPTDIESRRRPRFILRKNSAVRFYGFDVVLDNISESGCKIQHFDPLKMGASGTLVLENPDTHETIRLRGRVVWSRLSKQGDGSARSTYHSGLRFSDVEPETHTALAKFVTSFGEFDAESLQKKRESLSKKEEERRSSITFYKSRSEIPADVLAKITESRDWLQLNPTLAQKWYQRARFSRDKLKSSELSLRYQDEVIAVWELLGRRVPVTVIALALNAEEQPRE